jgi:hypothetical protein
MNEKTWQGERVVSCRGAQQLSGGISAWTWRRKALRGEVDTYKVGKLLLIPIREVERVVLGGFRPAVSVDFKQRAANDD